MGNSSDKPERSLIHRDDVPMELAEKFTAMIAELHPGAKVVFAGDLPGSISPKINDAMKAFTEQQMKLLDEGRCMDCERQMENWPPPDDEMIEWSMPDGWGTFTDLSTGDIAGLQCPECCAKDS